ncbi:MAG: DUF3450 domain-containing protein [Pseudomonadota bacterium]
MRAQVLSAVVLFVAALSPLWGQTNSQPSAPSNAGAPLDQINAVQATLEAARQRQSEVERLDDERRQLSDSVTTIADTGDAYAAQNTQLEDTLAALSAERAVLEGQLAQAAQTRQDILPLLREMTNALERFIASDIPFDLPRRQTRLDEARRDLDNPSLPLASRYRSIMNAWRAELDYAFRIRIARERLTLTDGAVLADTLQVGRAGFYYLLPDGSAAGFWNRTANQWEALPDAQRPALQAAMLAARDGDAGAVLQLPVAVP